MSDFLALKLVTKADAAAIRTTYDPQRKRGVARCLGTLSKSADSLPPGLAEVMTEAERAHAEGLVRKMRMNRDAERRDHYVKVLPVAIDYAAAWYLDPRNKPSVNLASDTREAFSKLLAAMVKAGVGRTRKRSRAAAVARSR